MVECQTGTFLPLLLSQVWCFGNFWIRNLFEFYPLLSFDVILLLIIHQSPFQDVCVRWRISILSIYFQDHLPSLIYQWYWYLAKCYSKVLPLSSRVFWISFYYDSKLDSVHLTSWLLESIRHIFPFSIEFLLLI